MATLGNSWAGLYRVQPSVTTRPTNPSHYQVSQEPHKDQRQNVYSSLAYNYSQTGDTNCTTPVHQKGYQITQKPR